MFNVAKRLGILAAAMVLLLGTKPSPETLKVGDRAPNVQAQSALAGKIVKFDLHDALAKNAVVLYFFPKAFSQG